MFLFPAMAAFAAEDGAPARNLSLGEAVHAALQQNFTVQTSRLDADLAGEGVRAHQGAFDPVLSAEYGYSNTDYSGSPKDAEDTTANIGISGVLPTGTKYYVGVDSSHTIDPFAGSYDDFDPDTGTGGSPDIVSSNLNLSLTQPLLRGFLHNTNQANLIIARRQRDQSDEAFRAAAIDTITATVQAYHNLYFAEQNLIVAERNRANAAQLLQDNRRRVDAGAMAPLDIYQAESEVAVRESAVISARQFQRTAENRLKSLIFNDPNHVLDERLAVPELPAPQPVEPNPQADYATALSQRPDYRQILAEESIRDTALERDRWGARPQLDLYVRAGRYTSAKTLSDSLGGLDGPGTDRYSVGVVFSRPLFNRTNDAQLAIAHLQRNRTTVLKKQLEQAILLQLDDAAAGVIAAWQRVESTRTARELAQKSLEAEEKKLQIGTSSTFVVLRLQGDLASAEIRELSAIVDYYTALADYESARGTTLEAFGVSTL